MEHYRSVVAKVVKYKVGVVDSSLSWLTTDPTVVHNLTPTVSI
jgi:hypothetical protein